MIDVGDEMRETEIGKVVEAERSGMTTRAAEAEGTDGPRRKST
jgi:hypothetical protein